MLNSWDGGAWEAPLSLAYWGDAGGLYLRKLPQGDTRVADSQAERGVPSIIHTSEHSQARAFLNVLNYPPKTMVSGLAFYPGMKARTNSRFLVHFRID